MDDNDDFCVEVPSHEVEEEKKERPQLVAVSHPRNGGSNPLVPRQTTRQQGGGHNNIQRNYISNHVIATAARHPSKETIGAAFGSGRGASGPANNVATLSESVGGNFASSGQNGKRAQLKSIGTSDIDAIEIDLDSDDDSIEVLVVSNTAEKKIGALATGPSQESANTQIGQSRVTTANAPLPLPRREAGKTNAGGASSVGLSRQGSMANAAFPLGTTHVTKGRMNHGPIANKKAPTQTTMNHNVNRNRVGPKPAPNRAENPAASSRNASVKRKKESEVICIDTEKEFEHMETDVIEILSDSEDEDSEEYFKRQARTEAPKPKRCEERKRAPHPASFGGSRSAQTVPPTGSRQSPPFPGRRNAATFSFKSFAAARAGNARVASRYAAKSGTVGPKAMPTHGIPPNNRNTRPPVQAFQRKPTIFRGRSMKPNPFSQQQPLPREAAATGALQRSKGMNIGVQKNKEPGTAQQRSSPTPGGTNMVDLMFSSDEEEDSGSEQNRIAQRGVAPDVTPNRIANEASCFKVPARFAPKDLALLNNDSMPDEHDGVLCTESASDDDSEDDRKPPGKRTVKIAPVQSAESVQMKRPSSVLGEVTNSESDSSLAAIDSDEETESSSRLFFRNGPKPYTSDEFDKLWSHHENVEGEDVEDIEKGKYVRGASKKGHELYGRILTAGMNKIFRKVMEMPSDCVYLDIGHGIGNTCLQAAYTIGCSARGLESVDSRNNVAERFKSSFERMADGHRVRDGMTFVPGSVELRLGELQNSEHTKFQVEDTDFAFCNNYDGVFCGERDGGLCLDKNIAALFAMMKEGAVLTTLSPLRSALGCLSRSEANAKRIRAGLETSVNASFYEMQVFNLGKQKDLVSWSQGGTCEKKVLAYRYTRTKQSAPGIKGPVLLCNNPACPKAKDSVPIEAVTFVSSRSAGKKKCRWAGPIIASCDCLVSDRVTRVRRTTRITNL